MIVNQRLSSGIDEDSETLNGAMEKDDMQFDDFFFSFFFYFILW